MDPQQQLNELERLAESLDVKVSYEPISGLVHSAGGLCRVRAEYRIIVDRKLKPRERVQVLVQALRTFDTEAHFLSPGVRELFDTA